jgi:hypothetical protein
LQTSLKWKLNYNTIMNRAINVRVEVFTAVTMKNIVFWDVGAVQILCEPTFRRNLVSHKIYTAPHHRRRHSCDKYFKTKYTDTHL